MAVRSGCGRGPWRWPASRRERVADVLAAEQEAGLHRWTGTTGSPRPGRGPPRPARVPARARRPGQAVVGYGAPGKGNTLLNYCGIRSDLLEYTVDRNPYKHGRFTPGTRIPILAPEQIDKDRPDVVLVLPWNLETEVTEQLPTCASGAASWSSRSRRSSVDARGTHEGRSVLRWVRHADAQRRDDGMPKPMQMVGPRPLIWHVMRYYAHFGHKEFILCLGYGAQHIKNYFLNYQEAASNDFVMRSGGVELMHRHQDWSITFVDTGLESAIGERLRRVRAHLDGEENSWPTTPTCSPMRRWTTSSRGSMRPARPHR